MNLAGLHLQAIGITDYETVISRCNKVRMKPLTFLVSIVNLILGQLSL